MISSLVIDPLVKVRDGGQLLLMPRVIRVTAFDEDSATQFASDVSLAHQTGQTILPIVIDSYGGDPYALWAMVDTLRATTLTVATIVEGKAMSCGAVLFVCGADGYRYIGPNATLMIHDVATDDVGGKAEDAKVDAKETDRLNKKMYAFMDQTLGKPKGFLWKTAQERGRTDWYLSAKEAVKHGIANKIGIPTFRTEVKVTMTLG